MVLSKAFMSMEDLSIEEQTAVNQLKQRMAGEMDPDLYDDLNVFVRFLRARDLNVNAAEAMLRKHIEWRKIFQVDTILTNYTPKEVLKKYVTVDVMGIDREGGPVLYLNFGQVDSRGILKSARKVEVTKCVVQTIEKAVARMKKESIKRGVLIDKWTIVINFEHFSFAVATHKESLEIASILIATYEANYPERLKEAYCINGSIYFQMAFAVVKHFISGPTYKKIKIFGKEGWREELSKRIPSEELPAFLGGKRTDPDGNPLCNTIITHGGKVPEKYYIKRKEKILSNMPGTKKLVVTRKSKSHVTMDVTEPGSHIEWEFETASKDIGFAVLYKEDEFDCKIKELIPKQRVETNISSETGMLKCDRPGLYIIEFDNSYSWIFQKEVYYRVSIKNNISID